MHKPIKEFYVKHILKHFKGLKINLILENPSEKLIKAVKAMTKIENTKVKLKKRKETYY